MTTTPAMWCIRWRGSWPGVTVCIFWTQTGGTSPTVKQRVLTFLPKFDLYLGDACIGTICKEFTIVRPLFTLNCNGWAGAGGLHGLGVRDHRRQRQVAAISKELLHWTDTYVIDVADGRDGLCALMVVLAIDAEKCSRNS